MIREQAHVPETLGNVRTPSVPLCTVVRVGGAPVHVCVMDVCTDGGVTVPICLCVCLQPAPPPRSRREGTHCWDREQSELKECEVRRTA